MEAKSIVQSCSRDEVWVCTGIAASTLLAQAVYDVPANVILNSAAKAVGGWDIATSMIKAWVFGVIISVVRPRPSGNTLAPCCISNYQLLESLMPIVFTVKTLVAYV